MASHNMGTTTPDLKVGDFPVSQRDNDRALAQRLLQNLIDSPRSFALADSDRARVMRMLRTVGGEAL